MVQKTLVHVIGQGNFADALLKFKEDNPRHQIVNTLSIPPQDGKPGKVICIASERTHESVV
jgi:hypothetical protein